MNGTAPNCSATGSHVDVTRNRRPKARMAGQPRWAISRTIAATTSTRDSAAVRSRARRIRSPVFQGVARASAAGPGDRPKTRPGSRVTTLVMRRSTRGHQRLALVRDLPDPALDLLDHRGRQRSVEEVVRVALALV